MSTGVSIDGLADAIKEELTIYSKDIINGIKLKAKESMSELVEQTKATAPVGNRKKHYKDSITSKKAEESDRSVKYVWYVNGPDYRLSHLLENGHALRNGGRYSGTQFIKNASDPILDKYIKAVEELIENG